MSKLNLEPKSLIIGFLLAVTVVLSMGATFAGSAKYQISAWGSPQARGCYVIEMETGTLYHYSINSHGWREIGPPQDTKRRR